MPEHTPAPTPHRAVYGFSFYLLFLTLSIVYMLWALLPIKELSGGYFSYLPDKYFALCLPMLVLCGIFFFIFFIYPSIGLSMTPNVDDLSSVLDTKIALRDCTDNVGHSLWEKVAAEASGRVTEGATFLERKEEMCAKCNDKHKPSDVPPITTLRFLDLSEMNKEFFGWFQFIFSLFRRII